MKKGILLTIDVFLALILFTTVMMIVLTQDFSDDTFNSVYLRSFTMEMLASFEKSGLFAESITDPSELRAALNALPGNICAQIAIINSTNSTVLEEEKDGCGTPEDFNVFHRTFYTEDELYLATAKTWVG